MSGTPVPRYFAPPGIRTTPLTRKTIPPDVKKAVHDLHTLDHRWNWIILWLFAFWLSAAVLAVTASSWAVRVLGYLAGGMAMSTFPVLAHEASHNLIFRRSSMNQWLGFLCGLPILFSSGAYRVVHMLHHQYVRTARDPDDIENISKNPAALRVLYPLLGLFGAYPYLILVPVNALRQGTNRQRILVSLEVAGMVGAVVAAWTWLPTDWMVHGWLIPLIVAGQIVNVRGITEHTMTAPGSDVLGTRTIVTSPLLSFLMCHINLHIEHHLYPGVPWYRLPALHRLLEPHIRAAGASVYAGYGEFMSDFIRAIVSGPIPGALLVPKSMR